MAENENDDQGVKSIQPSPVWRQTGEGRLEPLVLQVDLDQLSARHRGHGYDMYYQNSTNRFPRPQSLRLLVYRLPCDARILNSGVAVREAPALRLSLRGA